MSKKVKWNEDFIGMLLEVVKDGSALKDASLELKNNDQLVLEAVKQNASAYLYASDRLKEDPKIIKAAVTRWSQALQWMPEEYRDDPEIVMAAIENNEYAAISPLQYASDRLKNDPRIVMAAVKDTGNALQYASEELRGNKKIVAEAIKTHPAALINASLEVRADEELIALAKEYGEEAYKKDIQKHEQKFFDKEVESQYASVFGRYLKNMEPELQNNPEVVLASLKASYNSIEDVSENLEMLSRFQNGLK